MLSTIYFDAQITFSAHSHPVSSFFHRFTPFLLIFTPFVVYNTIYKWGGGTCVGGVLYSPSPKKGPKYPKMAPNSTEIESCGPIREHCRGEQGFTFSIELYVYVHLKTHCLRCVYCYFSQKLGEIRNQAKLLQILICVFV